jgi:hypothetical protein
MIVRRLIGWVLVFCISAIASADGLYSQLHNALSHPELPYQRALISHRNGVETLIVESELKGPKGDYAWIVPVPNPPTKVLEVNSESLERDFDRANPEFVAYQSVWPFGVFGILLLISALVAARNPSPKTGALLVVDSIILYLFLGLVAQPFMAPKAHKGVTTLSKMSVGAYNVEVVRSDDPKALDAWMQKNGGQLNPRAESAVANYVKEGWCFMVAKLDHSSGNGIAHPLAVIFPSKSAVYPMRLTAAQDNRVVVDLTILSDETATAEPLRIWSSKRFPESRLIKNQLPSGTDDIEDNIDYFPLSTMAWAGCAVTRLRGEMGPDQMTQDILIGSQPFKEEKLTVGSRPDFIGWALWTVAACTGLAAYLVSVVSCLFSTRSRSALIAIAFVAIIVSAGTWGYLSAGTEVIELNVISVPPGTRHSFL